MDCWWAALASLRSRVMAASLCGIPALEELTSSRTGTRSNSGTLLQFRHLYRLAGALACERSLGNVVRSGCWEQELEADADG